MNEEWSRRGGKETGDGCTGSVVKEFVLGAELGSE